MGLEGFEKISTNADVLIGIYNLLDLGDQLRLSCADDRLKSVFLNYIHRESYRDLRIVKRVSDVFVANTANPKPVLLQRGDLEYFLHVYAESVHELTESCSLRRFDVGLIFPSSVIDVSRFRNLTSLTYEDAKMLPEHLQLVAQCCPNLGRLHLIDCTTTKFQKNVNDTELSIKDILIIGDTLKVDTLLLMKNLRCLSIVNSTYLPPGIKYRHFRELVANSNLESLKVQNMLMPDHEFIEPDIANPPTLKELTVTTTFDSDKWSINFCSFLTNFENLVTLNLSLADFVTDGILKAISGTCKSLERLNIYNSIFMGVQSFQIPSKVTELSLDRCSGLTYANLRQILTLFKISKFTSKVTRYKGEFEDFEISPLIESLDVDGVYMNQFKLAYSGNENLRELTWHEDDDYVYDEGNVIDMALETCPNLKILLVKSGFIPLASLLQLANLNTLQLTIKDTMLLFNWSYVTALIQHPALTELTMDYASDDGFDHSLLDSDDCPGEAFLTTIQLLIISYNILEAGLHFWLDLLQRNRYLKLVCNNFTEECDLLKTIIYHEKFPKHVNTIDIWGSTIRCDHLRNNFDVIEEKLIEHNGELFPDFKNTDQIVLCGN